MRAAGSMFWFSRKRLAGAKRFEIFANPSDVALVVGGIRPCPGDHGGKRGIPVGEGGLVPRHAVARAIEAKEERARLRAHNRSPIRQRLEDLLALLGRSGPARDHGGDGPAMPPLGQERERRSDRECEDGSEFFGSAGDEVPVARMAQNRSFSRSSPQLTKVPSARTTSADERLSQDSPQRRARYPMPPPSVRPAMPVVETIPPVAASPKA